MVMPFVLFLLTGTTLIGLTLMEKEAQAASVFIADEESGTVTIVDVAIDLIAHAVKYRIAVDRGPHGLRLSPDARTIAVANTIGRSVSLIGVATGVESRRIYVAAGRVTLHSRPKETHYWLHSTVRTE